MRASEAAADSVEQQIEAWRARLGRSGSITPAHAAKLEDQLREQIGSLVGGGLAEDEALLVAVKRLAAIHGPTGELAREQSQRLWRQLASPSGCRSLWVAVALAAVAAAAVKIPALFGIRFGYGAFYALNIVFFTLPFIAAYFAWERRLARSTAAWLAGVFATSALAVNVFPFSPSPGADTETLAALHLPIALWLAVGVAYAGGRWRHSERRMDFIRFTGELFIYYVLIGLGGGVLIASTAGLFRAIGVDAEPYIESWILPCGIVGATVIATWLVEAKQSLIESMAPVLTRMFSPLFALLFVVFMATMVATGRGIDPAREILIAFDLLLVVVFGLLLYSISARDPLAPPGLLDWIQLALVATALAVDVLALWAIAGRISDFGFTPNRVAAVGENIVLLVNLAGSGLLYVWFLRGRAPFTHLAEWQTRYLYVLAAWAAAVAFLFPPLFGFR